MQIIRTPEEKIRYNEYMRNYRKKNKAKFKAIDHVNYVNNKKARCKAGKQVEEYAETAPDDERAT